MKVSNAFTRLWSGKRKVDRAAAQSRHSPAQSAKSGRDARACRDLLESVDGGEAVPVVGSLTNRASQSRAQAVWPPLLLTFLNSAQARRHDDTEPSPPAHVKEAGSSLRSPPQPLRFRSCFFQALVVLINFRQHQQRMADGLTRLRSISLMPAIPQERPCRRSL